MKSKVKKLTKIADLRKALIEDFRRSQTSLSDETLRKVVVEAEGLAALTPYPLLFFPALAEEKVDRMQKWATYQRRVKSESDIVFAA